MDYYVKINKKKSEEEKLKDAVNASVNQSFNNVINKANKGVSSGTPNTLPKIETSVLPKAESNLERASRIGNIEVSDDIINRGNNIVKGLGATLAATPGVVYETTKQSLSDWQDKVKKEGMANALSEYSRNLDNPTYTFGNAADINSKAFQNYAKAQGYYQKALEGLTPAQQSAGQIGISMLENAVTLPLAAINPAIPLATMGAKTAANKAYELTSQGKTATEAMGRGALSGAIEAITEKIPLDELVDAAKGGKSAVKSLLKQAGVEGSEEMTSYIMNYAADVSAGDENAKFSVKELAGAGLGGAVSGGIMGGIAGAIGNYLPSAYDTNTQQENTLSKVEVPQEKGVENIKNNHIYTATNNKASNTSLTDSDLVGYLKTGKKQRVRNQKNDILNSGEKPILKTVGEIKNFIRKSIEEYSQTFRGYGKVGNVMANDVYKKSNGKLDISGYYLELDSGHLYHMLEHKNDTEKGQLPLKESDIENITDYINNYDDIIDIEFKPDGKVNIILGKKINGHSIICEMVSKGRSSIHPATMYVFTTEKYNELVKAIAKKSGYRHTAQNEINHKEPLATTPNSTVNQNLNIVNPDTQRIFEDVVQAKENAKSFYQSAVNGLSPFDRITKADTRDSRRSITSLANKYGQKGGVVDTILTRGLYDINGNKVDNRSWVDVASQVPRWQLDDFNTYIHELHNIDRQAQGKPVTAHTIEESRKIVADLEAKYPQFKQYQKDINEYVDKVMHTYLVDAGMMSESAYRTMRKMYPNYIPTFRVGENNAGVGSVRAGKKIKNVTGVGTAKGGTGEVLSFDEAVAKKISGVVNAAIKNDISREIFSFAQALPDEAAKNGILIDSQVKNKDIDTDVDNIEKNELIRKISDGNYDVTFFNKGTPVTMRISRDVYEALSYLDNKFSYNRAMQIATGLGRALTGPMKALTTQYNPLFALTNIMRDVQTYTINNTASNSAVALKNYVKAIKEIATKSELYEQYRAMGGSQNGYYGENMYLDAYNKARPGNKKITPKGVLAAVPNAIEKVGNFTEMIPRVAEYMNTIDRLGNTNEGRLQASYNAADVTVNFNRSSTLSTLANAFVPYFNAGLQGMDKTLRQIKAHPGKTTARATASVFLPTLIFYLVNKDNPNWEDVKDGVRDSYYLIPNYAGPVDENGYAETFIRIPKSREFGALFSSSFERFVRALNESEETDKSLNETLPTAFDGYLQTLTNSFAPPDILGDNIFGSMRRLGTNTAWHGGKIVPSNLESVSPQYQQDINTSGVAKVIANATNGMGIGPDWLRSPMKLDYVIDSYGGYAGDLLQGLSSGKNIGSTKGETIKNSLYSGIVQPVINRFTTDSAYSNYNLDRFYNRLDELEIDANDKNFAESFDAEYKTPEEEIYSDFVSASKDISDYTKQEKKILESKLSIKEKNELIRELKQKKNQIAKDMLKGEQNAFDEYVANYNPELSTFRDDKREKIKEYQKTYNVPDNAMNDIMASYRSFKNDDDLNDLEKTLMFYNHLDDIGLTNTYKEQRGETNDLFKYGTVTDGTVKKYLSVSNILNPDEFMELKEYVSDIDYKSGVNGAKSKALRSAADDWIADYGLDLSKSEKSKIYLSIGVGKTYAY